MGKQYIDTAELRPIIFSESKHTLFDLKEFKKEHRVKEVFDLYEAQLEELFEVTNPNLLFASSYKAELEKFKKNRTTPIENIHGSWIYFPWNCSLLHVLNEPDLFALRTNRNKNLINGFEQEKMSKFVVAVAGLSIGHNITLSLIHSGLSDTIKIADYNKLKTTNLNRVRSGLRCVGMLKSLVTAQEIYNTNPYANIAIFNDGINGGNINEFIIGTPNTQLIFEAIDDFEMKLRIRFAAREARVPVIMLTNLGDNILVDVERYDIDSKLPLFNGLIGNISEEILSKPITEENKQRFAVDIVGKENVPVKALKSLPEIGKTLVGRPQLMSTVTVAAGIAAKLARMIALDEKLESGRSLIRLDNVFGG